MRLITLLYPISMTYKSTLSVHQGLQFEIHSISESTDLPCAWFSNPNCLQRLLLSVLTNRYALFGCLALKKRGSEFMHSECTMSSIGNKNMQSWTMGPRFGQIQVSGFTASHGNRRSGPGLSLSGICTYANCIVHMLPYSAESQDLGTLTGILIPLHSYTLINILLCSYTLIPLYP